MNEKAYLLVDILEENGQQMKVRSFLEDDSAFELMVNAHDVVKMPSSSSPKIWKNRGWLTVDYSGELNKRASITLPAPTRLYGQRVTVNTNRINRQRPIIKENVATKYALVDVVPEETQTASEETPKKRRKKKAE